MSASIQDQIYCNKFPSDALRFECNDKQRLVVLYLDKKLVEKSKGLVFNLSKMFENHLKYLFNEYSPVSIQNNYNSSKFKGNLVGPPGFEPGSIAPEATSLDQTSRRPPSTAVFAVFWWFSIINVGLALNFSG
jgi:hypothetical protein